MGASARRADIGLVLLAVLVMAVSGGMLWYAGLNYDGLTGNAAAKIHPATYLAFGLIGLNALKYGNPIGYVAAAGAARPGSLALVLAGSLLLAQTIAIKGPGLAGAIDTFILPGLMGLLLGGVDQRRRQDTLAAFETVVHVVLTVNAVLGIAEFILHLRTFPYRFDGAVYAYDTRATALQGHPLGNAAVTAIYVICLMSGGGRLVPAVRAGQVALQLVALVGFGGRSALAVTAVLGVVRALVVAHRSLRGGQVALVTVATVALCVVLVPIALAGLADHGTFDAIQARFTSDSASNGARFAMFNLFSPFSFEELLFGPELQRVETARRLAGLELGLENPLVKFALYNGLLMTLLLFIAVVLFLAEICKHSRAGLFLPLVAVTVLLNSFESLASKNTLLVKIAIMLVCLFRNGTGARGVAAGGSADDARTVTRAGSGGCVVGDVGE